MTGFDCGDTLAERFRAHAGESTHLYGFAMRGMADDWESGGPLRQICRGYEDARSGSVLQLRLLAGVFRLVLTGSAPELVRFYPCLGGLDRPSDAWPVMRQVFAEHVEELREALRIAPQTNEVGRSAALLAGLFDVVAVTQRRRIRLLELGASGGLNLLLDRYCYTGSGWRWGRGDSPVRLERAIEGHVQPESFTVAFRRGCDLHPVDVTTPAGRVLLTSFVWPFDIHRHRRLAAALQVAADEPARVDEATAGDWLAGQLTSADEPDVLTVVWHSITQMYWPPEEIDRVSRILDGYGSTRGIAQIAMEFSTTGLDAKPELTTKIWQPGQPVRQRLLGAVHDHGLPVRLAPSL